MSKEAVINLLRRKYFRYQICLLFEYSGIRITIFSFVMLEYFGMTAVENQFHEGLEYLFTFNVRAFLQLWETVQDSWDHDAEARITAGCIAGRIQNLSQRYPPSSKDPAHSLLFLAAPTSLINTSGASTAVSTASSLEAPGSSSAASPPPSSCIAPNPEVVPLLLTSNPPSERSTSGPPIEMVTDTIFTIFQFASMTNTPEGNVDMDIDSNGLGDAKSVKLEEQENGIGSLRSEAVRRKERLIELRKQAQNKSLPDTGLALKSEGGLPKPIFRNYNPISDDLKVGLLPERTMINLEARVADQLEAAKAEAVVDEVNLFNLAPRKPDWDLKRGIEKKLKKLERRTQRVIAELIRIERDSILIILTVFTTITMKESRKRYSNATWGERLKAEENSMATVEGPPGS
ncbi:hypothetical protein ACTXT7_007758 [Hymenolepis weldensis]